MNGNTLSYDAKGNLTSDSGTTYVYDAENHLTRVTGIASATLTYGPLGRLFQTAINGVTRQFLYDGDALIAEYISASTVAPFRRYLHGDQVDQPLVPNRRTLENAGTGTLWQ